MISYNPIFKDGSDLKLATNKPTAWEGIPEIIKDIMLQFGIKGNSAIEFGVEFGYSTSALSNYFKKVVGVDMFDGFIGDHFEETKEYLADFKNITLVRQSYKDFIKEHKKKYNLAHVDIVHTYEDTFLCGEWCVNHSDIVLFHDTNTFKEVTKACEDLSRMYNMEFYNFQENHGLGILVPKSKAIVIPEEIS